jgi:hypothetical protein
MCGQRSALQGAAVTFQMSGARTQPCFDDAPTGKPVCRSQSGGAACVHHSTSSAACRTPSLVTMLRRCTSTTWLCSCSCTRRAAACRRTAAAAAAQWPGRMRPEQNSLGQQQGSKRRHGRRHNARNRHDACDVVDIKGSAVREARGRKRGSSAAGWQAGRTKQAASFASLARQLNVLLHGLMHEQRTRRCPATRSRCACAPAAAGRQGRVQAPPRRRHLQQQPAPAACRVAAGPASHAAGQQTGRWV